MDQHELSEVEEEALLLLQEFRAELTKLQASVEQCLAIAKDTSRILASRPRPLQSL